MTDKLFYQDSYLKTFDAVVTGCTQNAHGFLVTLNRTAFYPEGGGQPADTGVLGGAAVLDVHEKDGEITHTTDAPLTVGETVTGVIDWERRFSLMQQHTGEHIVSGLIHRLFGLDNVGFHMGHDAVTIDLSGELDAHQLAQIELLANQAVYRNFAVETAYPAPETLETLAYRSKKELSGAVRIVTVPDYDVCACCGTHCAMTGEVGVIKLLSSQRYKGGVRVWMLCGERALADYAAKDRSVSALSNLLSAKTGEVVEAVERMLAENAQLKQNAASLQNQLFAVKAAALPQGLNDVCLFEDALSPADLRRFCLLLCEGRGGTVAVFSGNDSEGYKYALGSRTVDVRTLNKQLTAALAGRGGGAKELTQGSLQATRAAIEAFLHSNI